MQKGYNEIQGLEIELRILEQTSAPPSRPRKLSISLVYVKLNLIFYVQFQFFHTELFKILNKNKNRIQFTHSTLTIQFQRETVILYFATVIVIASMKKR